MVAPAPDYLTTPELADLLRIKQRKVYDLAASGAIPCTRAMGKLLFPREAVEAWLADHGSGPLPAGSRRAADAVPGTGPGIAANVFLGSHDPLLDWALRESRCGLATFFDGSLDGLDRFCAGDGIATGLHVPAADGSGKWNRHVVEKRCGSEPVVLVEWAWRQRGLVTAADNPCHLEGLQDLAGKRFVPRQPEAGAQILFEHLAAAAGLAGAAVTTIHPARSEADAALAVLDDRADAALGLAAVAHQHRLGFAPLMWERFDLLVRRKAWFDPPIQSLVWFCRSDAFAAKARDLTGYDVSGLGRVHFNGP